jgi:hypothetical protein
MKKIFFMGLQILEYLYNYFIIYGIKFIFSMKNNQTIQGIKIRLREGSN